MKLSIGLSLLLVGVLGTAAVLSAQSDDRVIYHWRAGQSSRGYDRFWRGYDDLRRDVRRAVREARRDAWRARDRARVDIHRAVREARREARQAARDARRAARDASRDFWRK